MMASVTSAQIITGNISGTIRDESGGILPGASVTITSPALPSGPASMVSNEKGRYRFPGLAPGIYTLNVTLSGFATYNEEGLRVEVGGNLERIVALKLASVAETVTVTGESPVVDTKSAGVSANFGSEYMENTPLRRFSMFDMFKVAPGVAASSPSSGDNPSVGAFGSSVNENAFLLDGTDFTSPISSNAWPYPDTDVIEEIEVVSLGASAEYGGVEGAVFNVVTKQGGNTFQFDASYYGQWDSLTTKPIKEPCDCPDGETGFTRGEFRDFTAHAGGPIVKDKAWIFGGYQYQRDLDNQPGTDPAFPRRWEADRVFWKLNWQITENLKLMQTYHDDYWDIPDIPSLSTPFETLVSYGGHNPSITFTDLTHVISANTFWDARVSGFYSPDDYSRPNSGSTTEPNHQDAATGVYSGGSYGFGSFTQNRTAVHAKASHYATDFLGADHDFKFGLQWVYGATTTFYGYPGGIRYYDYDSEPYYAYMREPYNVGGQFRNTGVFAEDVVRPSDRLTLSLGVRFDHSRAISQDLPRKDLNGNETGETVSGLGTLYTWNTVSPRLGLNYQLTRDGKTVLRANYGRFHRNMTTGEMDDVHPGVTPLTVAYFDPGTGGYTDILSVTRPGENLRIDPDMKSPGTHQFSFGIDRELAPNLGFEFTYVRKDGNDHMGWIDVGGVYGTDTATLEDGSTTIVYPLLNDTGDRVFLQTNPDGYFTDYNGVVLSLNKRWSDNWQTLVSYTWSESEGLINSNGRAPDFDQNSRAVSSFGRDPNDLTNATGKLIGDRTHMFRVAGAYEIPGVDILIGANFQYLTGRPYAGQANVRLPQGTRQIYVEPLGSTRLSSQSLLDLRVSKPFHFGESRKIEIVLDIINALQEKAEEAIITRNFVSDNYGLGNRFIDPMRAMIGVKFVF